MGVGPEAVVADLPPFAFCGLGYLGDGLGPSFFDDRRESALYWWRFAAGASDPLAAHLLGAHLAAVGHSSPDARIWRAMARMLGFTRERHLPQRVCSADHVAEGFTSHVPWGSALSAFMTADRLPRELVHH